MATSVSPAPAILRTRLNLPSHILERYENEAARRGMDLEALLSERLVNCCEHNSQKPLYFSDEVRGMLERTLGKNLRGAGQAAIEIQKALSLKVGKVEVPISPALSYRLHTRALSKPFAEYVKDTVTRLLEQEVGLR